jgi:hypothetical protein
MGLYESITVLFEGQDRGLNSQLKKYRGEFKKVEALANAFRTDTLSVDKALRSQGVRWKKGSGFVDNYGHRVEDLVGTFQKGRIASQRFNMNALGIMFAGMAMTRTFGNLNAASREWVGMNEIMSDMMGIVTLGATLDLLELGVIPLFDALTNLPEEAQKAIGILIYTLQGLGGFFMMSGQVMLGIGAFNQELRKIGDGTVLGGIKKLSGKLSTLAKFAGFTILMGIAIKDLSEGKVVAAIGDAMMAAGILIGGPGGIALMAVGLTLKLLGDEDFLVSVFKTMYKIGATLNSIIKESVLSAFTLRDFDVNNIKGMANVKRAFNRAIEEIQIEEAGTGVFENIGIPKASLDKLNEDISKLDEEYRLDVINKQEYLSKLEPLVDKKEDLMKRWRNALDLQSKYEKEQLNKKSEDLELSFIGNMATNPLQTIAKTFSVSNILDKLTGSNVSDAIISPSGNVISTHPDDYLIATKTPETLGGGGSVNVNPTYYITVSDKREFENMLRKNNENLKNEIRRIVKI